MENPKKTGKGDIEVDSSQTSHALGGAGKRHLLCSPPPKSLKDGEIDNLEALESTGFFACLSEIGRLPPDYFSPRPLSSFSRLRKERARNFP